MSKSQSTVGLESLSLSLSLSLSHTHIHTHTHTSICRLLPGQRYYYIYGDYYGWSEEKSFKAAPPLYVETNTTVVAYGGRYHIETVAKARREG